MAVSPATPPPFESLAGEVITPDHPEYDSARRVWNGMIDKRPAFIVRCAGVDDVATAIRFAGETGLPLAVRGGGGNFGVVTSFELELHRLGPDVYSLNVAYPVEDAAAVLAAWRDAVAGAPDEINSAWFMWTFPVVPELQEQLRGRRYVGIDGMYAGDPDEGERLMRGLRELSTPLIDASGPMSYFDKQAQLDPYFPAGLRYYWKALYLDELPDAAVDATVSWSEDPPSERTLIVIRHCGGAISRVEPEATAFGDRSSEWMLSIDATWDDPSEDERNISWTRAYWDDMHRFSSGKTYFNFPGLLEEGEAAVQSSYGANHERLARVKRAYDPGNRFRLNQNIRPAA